MSGGGEAAVPRKASRHAGASDSGAFVEPCVPGVEWRPQKGPEQGLGLPAWERAMKRATTEGAGARGKEECVEFGGMLHLVYLGGLNGRQRHSSSSQRRARVNSLLFSAL